MNNLKFSRQPVAYLTLALLIIQTVIDVLNGDFQFSTDLWDQFVTAVTAVVIYRSVTPVAAPNLSGQDA